VRKNGLTKDPTQDSKKVRGEERGATHWERKKGQKNGSVRHGERRRRAKSMEIRCDCFAPQGTEGRKRASGRAGKDKAVGKREE